jgi:hypothetical protein
LPLSKWVKLKTEKIRFQTFHFAGSRESNKCMQPFCFAFFSSLFTFLKLFYHVLYDLPRCVWVNF